MAPSGEQADREAQRWGSKSYISHKVMFKGKLISRIMTLRAKQSFVRKRNVHSFGVSQTLFMPEVVFKRARSAKYRFAPFWFWVGKIFDRSQKNVFWYVFWKRIREVSQNIWIWPIKEPDLSKKVKNGPHSDGHNSAGSTSQEVPLSTHFLWMPPLEVWLRIFKLWEIDPIPPPSRISKDF